MGERGPSRAAQNKKIRQEALREQLSNQKLCEQVIDSAKKLSDLYGEIDPKNVTLTQVQVQRIKAATDARLALIKKYLPDVSSIDISAEVSSEVKVIAAEPLSADEWERTYSLGSPERAPKSTN